MRNTYLPLKGALDPLGRTFLKWMPEWVSKRMAERINRDEVRTPMQWDRSKQAGFTAPEATPWLPLNADAGERNVAAQSQDAGSMLALYRALLHLRRESPALRAGSLTLLDAPGDLIAYERRVEESGDAVLVALNLGDAVATFGTAPAGGREVLAGGELLLGTAPGVTLVDGIMTLPAHTAAVVSWGWAYATPRMLRTSTEPIIDTTPPRPKMRE